MEGSQGTSLIQPPQVPLSIIQAAANNPELYTIYARVIDSEKIMYRNLLRMLHSSDYIEVPGFTEIPDSKGKLQRIPNPETKIVKLPSPRRICPKCHKVYDNANNEIVYCINPRHKILHMTEYLDWRPRFNENGFNGIMSPILAGTDEIMSSGNVNTKLSKEKESLPLKNMAYEKVVSILDMVTENTYDWSAAGKPTLTQGEYYYLGSEMFDHFYFTMSRSIDAFLLTEMGQATKTIYSNPQSPHEAAEKASKKGGLRELFLGT